VEIRVVLRDVFAASDLAWHLDQPARVSRGEDGLHTVHVDVGENVEHVLAEIRNWMTLHDVGPVTVHVGDERSHGLSVTSSEKGVEPSDVQ
jgi:hypothetical protein